MTVLDKSHNIYAVTAGDINASFYQAIDKADEIFVADIPSRADIVVSVAKYPMDIDLYQAQKAIDNGKLAMKDGGMMILVASCRDGIGEEAFARLLSSSDTPEGVLKTIQKEYKLGYHKAGKMAEVFLRGEVHAYTQLPDELLSSFSSSRSTICKLPLTRPLKQKAGMPQFSFCLTAVSRSREQQDSKKRTNNDRRLMRWMN